MTQFLTHLDLVKNELRNAVVQNLASAPSNPAEGQTYYDTVLKAERYFDGTDWRDKSGAEGTVTGVSGAAPITSTGGTSPTIGITEATTSAAGALSSADKTKLDGVDEGATANDTDGALRDRSTHTGEQGLETITGLGDELDAKQNLAQRNQANGYAGLDGDSKIAASQLPSLAISSTHVVADISERDALSVEEGDVAVVQDKGDGQPGSYIYDGSGWQKLLSPTTGVTEVIGGTGIDSSGGDTPTLSLAELGVLTVHLGDNQVTETKLSSAVRDKLNAQGALKHAETIGDGSAITYVVEHNLGTRDVSVTVSEAAAPYAVVYTGLELTSENSLTVRFSSAPSNNAYRVVVVG